MLYPYRGGTSKSRQVHLYSLLYHIKCLNGLHISISFLTNPTSPYCHPPLRTHPAPGCLAAFPRPGHRAGGWGPHRCTHDRPGSQTLSPSIWSHIEVSENTHKHTHTHVRKKTERAKQKASFVHFNSLHFVFAYDKTNADGWVCHFVSHLPPYSNEDDDRYDNDDH